MERLNSTVDKCDPFFINKLPITGADDFFVIRTSWISETVDIELIDLRSSKEWTSQLEINEMRTSAKELEIPFDEFHNECKRALQTNGGLSNFEYTIEDNSFILRKVEEFKEIFCQFQLTPAATALNQKILLESTNLIHNAHEELNAKSLEYQKLDMELKMLVQSYENVNAQKDKIEKDLLNKCSILLNSKKEKIAELQQLVSEGKRLSDGQTESRPNSPDGSDSIEPTQPLHLTQQPIILPKRKNLVQEKRATETLVEKEVAAAESEELLNSQNMFDVMQ